MIGALNWHLCTASEYVPKGALEGEGLGEAAKPSFTCLSVGRNTSPFGFLWGSVSAPGIFFDPCPTGDLLGGALSAVRAQCNYLDV